MTENVKAKELAEKLRKDSLQKITEPILIDLNQDTVDEEKFNSYCALRDEIVLFFASFDATNARHLLAFSQLDDRINAWIWKI